MVLVFEKQWNIRDECFFQNICFSFQDHTKLIVCPLMSAATYIDQKRKFRTLKFELMDKYGCSKDVL